MEHRQGPGEGSQRRHVGLQEQAGEGPSRGGRRPGDSPPLAPGAQWLLGWDVVTLPASLRVGLLGGSQGGEVEPRLSSQTPWVAGTREGDGPEAGLGDPCTDTSRPSRQTPTSPSARPWAHLWVSGAGALSSAQARQGSAAERPLPVAHKDPAAVFHLHASGQRGLQPGSGVQPPS